MDGRAISFGPFRLLIEQRLLLEGDRPVRLGSRAFDILAALVERPGEVVSKEQLIARAWPQAFVDESNLKFQVSALRRALGDGQGGNRYVITVPGRGYNFVAQVRREKTLLSAPASPTLSTPPNNLPFAVTRMIGRDDAVEALVTRLSRARLVTIVGAGGIGKSTVALAVAERMMAHYEHGVWLVDLAPLGDPRLVPSTVATVLGLEISAVNPLQGLVAVLRDRRMLLVLDNCEHLLDTVTGLAAAILSRAPGMIIMATSREPLGTAGESEYRLAPLAIPETSSKPTAAEVATFPSVQLFVERASAIVEDFALTDANAPAVAEICRRLDGLPLAIEFAAPRVAVLGVEGLAARLGESLRSLGARRRTTMPRRRTMRAVVGWSYGLLREEEQKFLRSLGVFAGSFTVEAATDVALNPATTRVDAINLLADLVAKSLVVADVSLDRPRFRLLDTTRAFVTEQLEMSGERSRAALRHAEHYRNHFKRMQEHSATLLRAADCARELDNLRAALDWSFSSPAHVAIGVELSAAYVPVWMSLSLAAECRERCERALLWLETDQISSARLRMQLQIGLGNSLLHTLGPSEQARTALTEALAIADTLDDLDAQLQALVGLADMNTYRERYNPGTAEAKRAIEIARRAWEIVHRIGDIPGILAAERRMGTSLLKRGRLSEAQLRLERVIKLTLVQREERLPLFSQTDNRAIARAALARALWLKGFADRARHEERASLDDLRGSSGLAMCRVLFLGTARIAPMSGDFGEAEDSISNLVETATRVNAPFWTTAGHFLHGKLLVERGAFAEGLAVLHEAFEICSKTGWRMAYSEFTGSVALALAGLGRFGEAHDVVTDAIEQAGVDGEQWYVPELLRIKGEVLDQQGSERIAAAESCLNQGAAMAREQGALFWELRIALSRCRLRLKHGQGDDGRKELSFLYSRFTEGLEMADLIAAKRFLNELT